MPHPKDDVNLDDISAYSDKNIDRYLENLFKRNKTLEDLLEQQEQIRNQLADATQAFDSGRTRIRWARRRYWLFIFIGVFREMWRILVLGKNTTLHKLKTEKADLQKKYSDLDEKLTSMTHQIDEITLSIDEVRTMISEEIKPLKLIIDDAESKILANIDILNSHKQKIEELDKKYFDPENRDSEHERQSTREALNLYIEQRDETNDIISQLNKKLENALNFVLDKASFDIKEPFFKALLDQDIEKYRKKILGSRSPNQDDKNEKIPELQKKCAQFSPKNPVINALDSFLTYRTEGRLRALQEIMRSHVVDFKNQEIVHLLEEAGEIDSRILDSIETKLPSIDVTLKDLSDKKREYNLSIEKLREALPFSDITRCKTTFSRLNLIEQRTPGEDDALKDVTKFLQQYDDGMKKINQLENNNIEIEKSVKALPSDFTPELLKQLIESVKKHPTLVALSNFLEYPVPSLLDQLRIAMDGEDYKNTDHVKTLLEQAKKYYPQIDDKNRDVSSPFFNNKNSKNIQIDNELEDKGDESRRFNP